MRCHYHTNDRATPAKPPHSWYTNRFWSSSWVSNPYPQTGFSATVWDFADSHAHPHTAMPFPAHDSHRRQAVRACSSACSCRLAHRHVPCHKAHEIPESPRIPTRRTVHADPANSPDFVPTTPQSPYGAEAGRLSAARILQAHRNQAFLVSRFRTAPRYADPRNEPPPVPKCLHGNRDGPDTRQVWYRTAVPAVSRRCFPTDGTVPYSHAPPWIGGIRQVAFAVVTPYRDQYDRCESLCLAMRSSATNSPRFPACFRLPPATPMNGPRIARISSYDQWRNRKELFSARFLAHHADACSSPADWIVPMIPALPANQSFRIRVFPVCWTRLEARDCS